jgi:hypothetical protein
VAGYAAVATILASTAPRRIGRYAALALHDLVQPVRRHLQAGGSGGLAESERFEEFFEEHFPGMGRGAADASEIDSTAQRHACPPSNRNVIRYWSFTRML